MTGVICQEGRPIKGCFRKAIGAGDVLFAVTSAVYRLPNRHHEQNEAGTMALYREDNGSFIG
ncbi:MAG: hypothetical protein AAF724_08350 [Pseudomonadota bacterium]